MGSNGMNSFLPCGGEGRAFSLPSASREDDSFTLIVAFDRPSLADLDDPHDMGEFSSCLVSARLVSSSHIVLNQSIYQSIYLSISSELDVVVLCITCRCWDPIETICHEGRRIIEDDRLGEEEKTRTAATVFLHLHYRRFIINRSRDANSRHRSYNNPRLINIQKN